MQDSGTRLKEPSEPNQCPRSKHRNTPIQLQGVAADQTGLREDQLELTLNASRDNSLQASDFSELDSTWTKSLECSRQLLNSAPAKTDLKRTLKCLQKQNTALNSELYRKNSELDKKEHELEQLNEALEGLQSERHLDTIAYEEQLSGHQAKFLCQITELHSQNSALEACHKRDQAELEGLRAALTASQSTTSSLTHSLQQTEQQLKKSQHKAKKQLKLLKCARQVREDSARVFSLYSDTVVALKFRVEKLYKQLVLEMSKPHEIDGSFGTTQFTGLEHGLNGVLVLLHERIENILGEGPRASADEQALRKQLHRQATLHARGPRRLVQATRSPQYN